MILNLFLILMSIFYYVDFDFDFDFVAIDVNFDLEFVLIRVHFDFDFVLIDVDFNFEFVLISYHPLSYSVVAKNQPEKNQNKAEKTLEETLYHWKQKCVGWSDNVNSEQYWRQHWEL